ncbi:hypothetical protein [Sphingomonas sp. 3-13AW]|uniref:hypothetical protein n=1 Tax=Sphingomonas sp. 3-13AW TaxID=3050450 RepID=UPI003BB52BFF
MITASLSVTVPVIDNTAAMVRLQARIARDELLAGRRAEFASTPLACQDAVLIDLMRDRMLVGEHQLDLLVDQLDHLFYEHGAVQPTQESWDALSPSERDMMLADYLDTDCRTGMWEFNPWGPLIERNNPLAFQSRRSASPPGSATRLTN